MAGITKVFSNGCIRIYRTFSYRDSNNKAQHIRKTIGKIDINTNKPVFNKFFINLITNQGISIDQINNIPLHDIPKIVDFGNLDNQNSNNNILNDFNPVNNNINASLTNKITIDVDGSVSIEDEVEFTAKNYGPFLLLTSIVNKIGLLDILKSVFPNKWIQIISLAYYLVCNNKSIMHCDNWIEKTELYANNISLQSQRISELFSDIEFNHIMSFFELWRPLHYENEYLALDITSVSSYSNLIKNVEHGYNRDGDKLRQINICMLFGEKSGLPMFSSMFSGSINDVSTLNSFIEQIELFNTQNNNLVMDKGFYSINNLKILLRKFVKYKFLVAVPFTTEIARKVIADGKDKFDRSLSFKIGDDILDAYSFKESIDNNHSVIYYVYYNSRLYSELENKKFELALSLKDEAILNPEKYINHHDCKKYLIFKKDKETQKYSIKINVSRILYECRNKAWLIIVGNDNNLTPIDVINIYRNKDVVEKAFCRFKNQLGMKRTRVHSDDRLYSKIFISTIALIINSFISNVIKDNKNLNYTVSGLIEELEKIKILRGNNNRSISPISKNNRHILAAFGIKIT